MNAVRQFLRTFSWWHELVLLLLLCGLMLAADSFVPGFASLKSQLFLSRQLWEYALLALGMTLIILTGGIDLSVGSIMGLSAVAFGQTYQWSQRADLAAAACLVTGLVCGAINGALIGRLQLHPLIVTLATFAAYRGIAEGWSQGVSYSRFGTSFSQLARGHWAGLPWPGYLFLALTLLCGTWLHGTPGGRYLYAMGHNPRAALFSGIPVDRIRTRLYLFSGFLAGLATIIYVSRFDTAKADAGLGFELDVITAVVVGGTSIFGGRGNLFGTCLGLLLIYEVRLFIGRYWDVEELKSIVVGALLIGSILVSRALTRDERES